MPLAGLSSHQALFELREDGQHFEAAVVLAEKRRDARKRFDLLATAVNKAKKLDAQAEQEVAKFDDIRQAHHERMNTINAQMKAARAAVDAGNAARDFLLDASRLPPVREADDYRDALDQKADAEAAAGQARRAVRDHAERVKSEERWVADLTAQAEGDTRRDSEVPGKLADHKLALSRAERRQREAQQQLDAAETALAAAEKRLAGMRAKILDL